MKKISLITLPLLLAVTLLSAGCGAGTGNTPAETKKELTGNVKVAGSTSVQPLAEELALKFSETNKQVKIDIAGGGSGVGVEAAANGTADIGMASRELKQSEKDANPTLKDIVIAKDGIAVIVNTGNAVSNLSLEQIKEIFSGKITNWKAVGGKDLNITVVNREEGSGTRGAFEEIVLGKDSPFTDKAIIQNSTGAVKTAVAADVNAIEPIEM